MFHPSGVFTPHACTGVRIAAATLSQVPSIASWCRHRATKSPPGVAQSVAATARYRELPRPDGQLEAERELSS